ncbi:MULTISPECIES: D-lactate dehydrogenase [Alphaproteobacteria]|uniref:D-lactate dehydrogenase n=1 Tax=Alphaproteobacteria TaxID=28211 RepID=UPI0032673A00
MTSHVDQSDFLAALETIVGKRYVLTSAGKMRRYCEGYRLGRGRALAIVRPGSLVEQWQVADLCVQAGIAIVMQAANTGLTGGSTPYGDYGRAIIVINTMRLKGIELIDDGKQAICLPGATLFELDRLLTPHGREPHSEIGSSCLGATVHGGICNSSGGALVRRGPAYTEAALFAKVLESGRLELVNHLGVHLGSDPEEILRTLDERALGDAVIEPLQACSRNDYTQHVRQTTAATPARFNADPKNLFEASGSAGKVIVFAVRVDTFDRAADPQVVHIATDDPGKLTRVKNMLLGSEELIPIAAEYIHRDMFETAMQYGRDTFTAISLLGTERLPALFSFKSWLDRFITTLPLRQRHPSDRLLQLFGRLLPYGLPKRFRSAGQAYEHHLLLKVDKWQVEQVAAILERIFGSDAPSVHFCSQKEGRKLFLHRFVAAGAAIRYEMLHSEQASRLVALDIALRRDDRDWHKFLPEALSRRVERQFVYGHYFCNVLHLDFIVNKGEDPEQVKADILEWYSSRGAEYPAEHNVGHVYVAPPQLSAFYKTLDPTNALNPGIGKTSKSVGWR